MKHMFAGRSWRVIVALAIGLGAVLVLRCSAGSAQVADSTPASSRLETRQDPALAITNQTYTVNLPLVSRCRVTRVPPFSSSTAHWTVAVA